MANIPPISVSSSHAAAPASTETPSLQSQLTKHVSIASKLESSLMETLEKVGSGQRDAGTMIQLSALLHGLNISSAAISRVTASMAEDAKRTLNQG